jgi:predicted metalloprotease
MRWGDFRRSENIEDVGRGGGRHIGFGGPVRLSGGAIIVAVIAGLVFGVNPLDILSGMGGTGPAVEAPAPAPPPGTQPQQASPERDFVAAVLGSTEDVWKDVFQRGGAQYDPPKLRLFRDTVQSACGYASAASGPFYCSADRRVYLDTAFFDELERRFGAPGDFAQAYVIAHEIGHHVQNALGVMDQFARQQRSMDQASRNALSVRLELQADCFAGIWGHYVQRDRKLEPGDLEEGLRAAAAVGDDQIQKRSRGYVVPESFTHGSASQRMRWFRAGFESGDVRACNTFAGP